MPPGSYLHDSHGINLKNLRSIAVSTPKVVTELPTAALELLRQPGNSGEAAEQSTRLRHGAAALRAMAAQQVELQLRGVEDAIRGKLAKTREMAASLQKATKAVDSELAALSRCQQRLASTTTHLHSQLGLNAARQEVRGPRGQGQGRAHAPGGGADEVGRQLHHQRLTLDDLVEKVSRCQRSVEADVAKLQEVRGRLLTDLKGKSEALTIDEAVLGLHGGSTGNGGGGIHGHVHTIAVDAAVNAGQTMERPAAGMGDGVGGVLGVGGQHTLGAALVGTSPGGRRRWEGDTLSLVSSAQQLVAESARLRKRVKQLLLETSAAVVGSANVVNSSLADRIQDTRGVRAQLQERLRQVEQEARKAAQEQDSLRRSLDDKRAPLEQLQARFDLRRRRPDKEHVADEVESALAAEAAGLAAVARQLQRHEVAVGEQVRQLQEVAAALRPGIDDRAAAEEIEEMAARLDGREDIDSPRAPSIVSVCASTVCSGYSQLGDSASQVCLPMASPPSILAGPPAKQPHRHHSRRQSRQSQGQQQMPPAVFDNAAGWTGQGQGQGSQLRGGGGGSVLSGASASSGGARSAASSGAVRGAVARIAALERELANARLQTAQLENELRGLQLSRRGGSAVGDEGSRDGGAGGAVEAGAGGVRGGSVVSAARGGGGSRASGWGAVGGGGVARAGSGGRLGGRPGSAGVIREGGIGGVGAMKRPMTAAAAARLAGGVS